MTVLSDKWIRKMSEEQEMISPFEEKQVRGNSISYGLSSFGYDARVSDEFKIFTNVNSEIVDPKNFKPTNFVTKNTSECIIPPNSFVLARTVEKFKIPDDVLVICLGKSTYARCGIIVNADVIAWTPASTKLRIPATFPSGVNIFKSIIFVVNVWPLTPPAAFISSTAVEEINAAGGVNGHTLTTKIIDLNMLTPEGNVAGILNLVEAGVHAITSAFTIIPQRA